MIMAQTLNLIKAGYEVVVYNRSRDKCQPVEAAGAKVRYNSSCTRDPFWGVGCDGAGCSSSDSAL